VSATPRCGKRCCSVPDGPARLGPPKKRLLLRRTTRLAWAVRVVVSAVPPPHLPIARICILKHQDLPWPGVSRYSPLRRAEPLELGEPVMDERQLSRWRRRLCRRISLEQECPAIGSNVPPSDWAVPPVRSREQRTRRTHVDSAAIDANDHFSHLGSCRPVEEPARSIGCSRYVASPKSRSPPSSASRCSA
jgi:hypothetical protein